MDKEQQNDVENIIINVKRCQRCGEDHNELVFGKLDNPVDIYGYWSMCPTILQPILLGIIE